MVTVLLALAACGSPDPESLRSIPTPATVVLTEAAPEQEIVWTDLEEVFPARAAALPAVLAELHPGMDGAKARAVLESAREPGVKTFSDRHGDTIAVASMLAGTTNVGITLLLGEGGARLDAVDISIPDDVAVPMLTTRWGAPTDTTFQDGGAPLYRWVVSGEPWTAALYSKPGDRAIVKFEVETDSSTSDPG